jgi:phosphocarrier protein FPr
MLTLINDDITLQQSAQNKTSAIKAMAAQLTEMGFVSPKYVDGMLQREQQNSTFLGNGIAIPHGTTDTRNLVNKTGVAVHHFPEGVNWGDGNIAYVAIGIAAKSDEHLGILKQLTKALSEDGVEAKLKQAKTKADIIALLNGEMQLEADFDASLIQLHFPANDLIQMSAVTAGLLKNNGNVDKQFIGELVTKEPTHLGNGLWLVSSNKGVKRAGMSIVSVANSFEFDHLPVLGLIAIASANNTHQSFLTTITKLVFAQQQASILSATTEQLLKLFLSASTSANEIATETSNAHSATFKINNTHGLHARPSAMLVAEAKKYASKITVLNVNGDGKSVDAKNLMKVISLSVKHGHELQFTAIGSDEKEALVGIGEAIASGLSEG